MAFSAYPKQQGLTRYPEAPTNTVISPALWGTLIKALSLNDAALSRYIENTYDNVGFIDIRRYGAVANNTTFDNGPAINQALTTAALYGFSVLIPEGTWYFSTDITLTGNNRLVGAGTDISILQHITGATPTIKVESELKFGPKLSSFRLIGQDATDPDSVGVTLNDIGSSRVGSSFTIENVRFSQDLYMGIKITGETDSLIIKDCQGFSNYGYAWLWGEVASSSAAPAASIQIIGCHVSRQNSAVYGQNKYGIHLSGFENAFIHSNIINGFDTNFDIIDNSPTHKSTRCPIISSNHSEDFRPFINDLDARANSTAYSSGKEVTYNNYSFTATTGGTSAGSPPTFTYTIGASTTDGTVVWQCVSRSSPRWTAARTYAVGELVKPTATYIGQHAIFEVTVGGLGGGTEPAWPTEYDDTVTDGAATLKLTHKSTCYNFESTAARSFTLNSNVVMACLNMLSIGGKASVACRELLVTEASQGDTRTALFCKPLSANVQVSFEHCLLRGNIIPYNVAFSDTYKALVTRTFGSITNDTCAVISTSSRGPVGIFEKEYAYSTASGSITFDLSVEGIFWSSSTGTITIPTPTKAAVGRTYTIYAGHSNGVTVAFPTTTRVNGEDVTSVYLPRKGSYIKVFISSTPSVEVLEIGPLFKALLFDEKSSGTAGGTATSGSWQLRDLTTESFDPGQIVSLASNKFTLVPGSYVIRAFAPAYLVDGHKLRVYDVTNATGLTSGQSAYANATTQSVAETIVNVTITSATEYQIEHNCTTTRATDGWGQAAGIGGVNERYTYVYIERLF